MIVPIVVHMRFLVTLVVFRAAVVTDIKEKEETRYALLTEELT